MLIASVVLALALQTGPGVSANPAPPPPAPTSAMLRRVDDLTHPLDGMVPQGSYEEGVRGAFSRTQSRQGPLDGTWTLKDAAGAGLYRFQLVDRGAGAGEIEGAWSDLQAGVGSGFLAAASRTGERLTLEFAEPDGALAIATLAPRPDGGYAGELATTAAGQPAQRVQVSLVRP